MRNSTVENFYQSWAGESIPRFDHFEGHPKPDHCLAESVSASHLCMVYHQFSRGVIRAT